MGFYEEVKKAFTIDCRAYDMAKHFKQHSNEVSGNDILYIFKNSTSKIEFEKYFKQKYLNFIYDPNYDYFYDHVNSNVIYMKTLEECENLQGYRFKKIYFCD